MTLSTLVMPAELPAKALSRPCDPQKLGFTTTDELPDLQSVIGQPRAIRALDLGSEVGGPGYNIFVLGLPGSGRTTLTHEYLDRKALTGAAPDDWCYVFNFENPHKPLALRLPAGQGSELRKDMQTLIANCEREMPKAFESEEYVQERDRLVNGLKKQQEEEFQRLQEHVGKFQFILVRTPMGIILTPGVGGKPLSPEEVEKLSLDQKTKMEQLAAKLSEEVEKTLNHLRQLGHDTAEKVAELTARTAIFLISPWIEPLKTKYADLGSVSTFLEAAQNDLVKNASQFKVEADSEQPPQVDGETWTKRYTVNLLVDNKDVTGAPVILESHPSYHNLIGRIEHVVVMGAARTDFSMIRPGALHRANGGYLILPARDLLINPYAWEGLKRVLRDGAIRIIELSSELGLMSSETLEPEPIPLNMKVVLVGTPMLYYLLRAYDEDFAKLFKVRADFASIMERTQETEQEYGLFVKSVVMDNHLPPFDNTAVARVIEHSAKLAEDQNKLTTRFGLISDLVREAAYWAKKDHANHGNAGEIEKVSAGAVQRAIDESIYRSNLVEERIQELITQDTLLIASSGSTVGQINGLSVYMLGDYAFGRPTRLTASVYAGKSGVIDIERQAKLSGPIHTKGVLIISGFLGSRFGRHQPLSLTASLTFEQSYDEIEGDSASAAELLALLSAIAQVPLRQDIAITGSINQHGEIQAIGGVNEKIEGFFAVCQERGLTGSQGVIIPAANQRNLMLRAEIIQAVAEQKFHLWPVQAIEECLALFAGYAAGELQPDGSYPEGTFNRLVTDQLAALSKVTEEKKSPPAEEKPATSDGDH